MVEFDPIPALAGGVLIGVAAGILWCFNGRIAGIAGILASSLAFAPRASAWRWAFLSGLIGGAATLFAIDPGYFPRGVDGPLGLAIVAGLAVGIGTRLGGGCTSGHGVCGMARLSPRSIVATLIFIGTGMLTVMTVNLWS